MGNTIFNVIFGSALGGGIFFNTIASCFINDWRLYPIAAIGSVLGGILGFKSYRNLHRSGKI
jgi:hypothetical protein